MEINHSQWNILYKAASIAAIIMAIFIPIQGLVFSLWPPPKIVADWFILFQKNSFIGLLDMDLLLTIDYLLFILIFLALWAALRHINPSLTTIALVFQLVGITTYFSSTAAFEMLNLSNQYADATSDAERIIIQSAGQAMISTWQGTAFNVSYICGCIALIAMSVVMLRSTIFNKATAWLGLIAGILMTVPPTAGRAGMIISFLSLIPVMPWLILIAQKFSQLGRTAEKTEN